MEDHPATDHFYHVYDRKDCAYGEIPSAPLVQYLDQSGCQGIALDLGAGPGRDSIALARRGYDVTSIDTSARGLQELERRCQSLGLAHRVDLQCADVRHVRIPRGHYDVIVATTILDHLPIDDAEALWQRMVAGLADQGVLYVEVHTTDDPGCQTCTAEDKAAPVSETAEWVVNYFKRGLLLAMAVAHPRLRILRYEERYEWDYTHGPEHKHAKAILLATTAEHDPPWFGYPRAFPKQT